MEELWKVKQQVCVGRTKISSPSSFELSRESLLSPIPSAMIIEKKTIISNDYQKKTTTTRRGKKLNKKWEKQPSKFIFFLTPKNSWKNLRDF